MESELRPRDVQARVRAGVSVEELAGHTGMSPAMVERFAAPVLAERAHVAGTAMSGTLRRSGESTSHRTLRLVVAERLSLAGVDLDAVEWDAYRAPDGRWAVTATYQIDDEPHVAEFRYQQASRFSVTANDEARGLVGEKAWPPAGEDSPDDEPTVDLADEFALARAVQQSDREEAAESEKAESEVAGDEDRAEAAGSPTTPVDPVAEVTEEESGEEESGEVDADEDEPAEQAAEDVTAVAAEEPATGEEPGPSIAAPELSEDATTSQLDRLFAMFDGPADDVVTSEPEQETTEDTGPIYAGLSDAAAVPDVETGGDLPGDDTAAMPLEPSLFDDDPRFSVPERPKRTRKRPQRKRKGRKKATATATADSTATVEADAGNVEPEVTKAEPEAEKAEKAEPETEKAEKAEPETEKSGAGKAEPAKVEDGQGEAGTLSTDLAETEEPESAGSDEGSDDKTKPDDDETDQEPASKPAPKPRKRKGRASVPSWDEIMFGSPRRR